jgi:hypothetical protein
MKMPEVIDSALLAPCGVNCLACYAFLRKKRPCHGCLHDDAGKPYHCTVCAIKTCAASRGLVRCLECDVFPCARIKRLDKRYKEKYGVDLVANGRAVACSGLEVLLAGEKQRWTCPDCDGILSQHDRTCSECGGKEPGEQVSR